MKYFSDLTNLLSEEKNILYEICWTSDEEIDNFEFFTLSESLWSVVINVTNTIVVSEVAIRLKPLSKNFYSFDIFKLFNAIIKEIKKDPEFDAIFNSFLGCLNFEKNVQGYTLFYDKFQEYKRERSLDFLKQQGYSDTENTDIL